MCIYYRDVSWNGDGARGECRSFSMQSANKTTQILQIRTISMNKCGLEAGGVQPTRDNQAETTKNISLLLLVRC